MDSPNPNYNAYNKSRERILAVLNGEIPDRVPYFETDMSAKIIGRHYGVEYKPYKSITTLKWLEKIPGWRLLGKMLLASEKTYVKLLVNEVAKYRKMKIDGMTMPVCLFPNKNWDTRKQRKFTMPHIDEYVDEFGRFHRLTPTKYEMDMGFYIDGALTSEELYDEWGPIDPHAPVRMEIYNAAVKTSKEQAGHSSFPESPVSMKSRGKLWG